MDPEEVMTGQGVRSTLLIRFLLQIRRKRLAKLAEASDKATAQEPSTDSAPSAPKMSEEPMDTSPVKKSASASVSNKINFASEVFNFVYDSQTPAQMENASGSSFAASPPSSTGAVPKKKSPSPVKDMSKSPSPVKEMSKSPTPGPFSALLVPVDRGDSFTPPASTSTLELMDVDYNGENASERGKRASGRRVAKAAKRMLWYTDQSCCNSFYSEVSEKMVRSSMQNIFCVTLYGSSNSSGGNFLGLPELNASLIAASEEMGLDSGGEPSHLEIASDILLEVLMGMVNGMHQI